MALANYQPSAITNYELGRRVGPEQQAQQIRSLAALAGMIQSQQALGLKREDLQSRSADRDLARQQQFAQHRDTIAARLKVASDAAEAKIEAARQSGADRKTLMDMQIQARRDIAAEQVAARRDLAQFMVQNRPTQPPVPIADPKSPTGFAYGTREQALGKPAPAPAAARSPFETELQKQTARDYSKIVQGSGKTGDQLDLVKGAIEQFRDYSQSEVLGTGPFATLYGLTTNVSAKTEALEATFKTINLKNLVSQFEGFSRAIDAGSERRAWEATQPGVARDDPTNAQILVGGLSLAAKAQAEGEARKQYIESSPDKTLKGYNSPVIGKTSVLFTPEGDPIVVPKDRIEEGKANGLMTNKEYEQSILGKKSSSKVDSLLEKYK